jgi:predicted dehydrogenase
MRLSSQAPVRLAVVGCGAVATLNHLLAIAVSQKVEAAVLVDANLGRAEELARRFGVKYSTTDWKNARDRFEAAVVALPNHLHAPVTIALLEQGVHVLVEKPMAVSTAEADAMIAAAERAGAVLAVGLDFRFIAATRLVKSLLDAGILGPLRGFDLRQGVIPRWPFATDFLYRKETAGGGVLADFGVHLLDLLLYWLGEATPTDYRDDAAGGLESDCLLELAFGEVSGTVEISRTRNLRNTCIFTGERATLEAGIWDPDPEVALSVAGASHRLAGRARSGAAEGTGYVDIFRRQIDDFAAAVRGRREQREPFVSGREGRRSLALIEACYARRQPWVLPWTVVPAGVESSR